MADLSSSTTVPIIGSNAAGTNTHSQAASFSSIPPELFDIIVRHLRATDKIAAICLALTCRRFHQDVKRTLPKNLKDLVVNPNHCDHCIYKKWAVISFLMKLWDAADGMASWESAGDYSPGAYVLRRKHYHWDWEILRTLLRRDRSREGGTMPGAETG